MRASVAPRIKKWFVCFTDDTNTRFWYDPLIKPGFRHCYAFGYDNLSGAWIIYDPAWDNLIIRVLNPQQLKVFIASIIKKETILEVDIAKDPMFLTRHFHSCVTSICHLVGINILIPTPYRLYCALRKNGAQVSLLSKNLL